MPTRVGQNLIAKPPAVSGHCTLPGRDNRFERSHRSGNGPTGTDSDKRRIDSKGRVTIPEGIRRRLALEAGEHVEVDVEDGAVVIRPKSQVSRSEFVEPMEGCITAETRREPAGSLSPDELKADWTSDLPDATE